MKALTNVRRNRYKNFNRKRTSTVTQLRYVLKEISEESATQIIDEQRKQMNKLVSRLEEELCHKKQLQEQMQAMKQVDCHASKDNTRHEWAEGLQYET